MLQLFVSLRSSLFSMIKILAGSIFYLKRGIVLNEELMKEKKITPKFIDDDQRRKF